MRIISEQQTYAKITIAPLDFARLCDEEPSKALEYITKLQGEREKTKEKKQKAEGGDETKSSTKRGRKLEAIDISQLMGKS